MQQKIILLMKQAVQNKRKGGRASEASSLTLEIIMIIENVLNFFDHFPGGLYLKTIKKPLIHGFFNDRERLAEALAKLEEEDKLGGTNTTLFFLGNKLEDTSALPQNCFKNIPKGGGIKKENVVRLKYLLIDIDPIAKKEKVDGKSVDKNLSVEEHQAVIADAMLVKTELESNGFTNIGIIDSGNGCYVLLPFKNFKSEKIAELKGFVNLLKKRLKLTCSEFDVKTISPEHVFKVPGTLSTKGVETEDNPYRHAEVLVDWDSSQSCLEAIKAYISKYATCKLLSYSSVSPIPYLNVKECIEEFENLFPVYFGGNHDYYIRIPHDNLFKDILIASEDFERELRNYIRDVSGEKLIDFRGLGTIAMYLSDQAYLCDPAVMASRAYYDTIENKVYYDLCNQKDVIVISESGIEIIPKPLGMFAQQLSDKEQVMYEPTPASELPSLLEQITTLRKENTIILAVYLCCCCMGRFFPFPFLSVVGNQGSSKSTLTGQIQDIVHPQTTNLFTLNAKEDDLAIALSSRLLTCFDNISGVKSEIADLLCSAITGGAYHKRELYTTAQERIIPYKSIIVINGLDVVSRRTDFMQRCVLLELDSITPEKRKTSKEVEAIFRSLLPKILGAIFDAIQKVLAMDDFDLKTLSRMADFEIWSCKFAKAMDCCTVEEFQKILSDNAQKVIDAVSFGNPTVFAIVEFMCGKAFHEEGVESFYSKCLDILREKATPHEVKMFPGGAAAFSRAIAGLEPNLKTYGITVSKINVGPNKQFTITNDGSVIPAGTSNIQANKLVYENQPETGDEE